MGPDQLRRLLEDVRTGALNVEGAVELLRALPYEDLGFARVDHHRHLRQGFPEVIFCLGKTVEQVVAIATALASRNATVMGTRADVDVLEAVAGALPGVRLYPEARIFVCGENVPRRSDNTIAIVSAGTADLPVAEEAAVTAEVMGNAVARLYDVGVAGIHRLLDNVGLLQKATTIVVVAGMDGALPSVVGGLVSVPVIAVPTSVGYGAAFQGLAPLLTMLNSCASGVGVVNIDNGFGAGYLASTINRQSISPPCP